VTSSDGPFLTPAHGASAISAAGDNLRICNDGVYSITTVIRVPGGDADTLITVEGSSSRGAQLLNPGENEWVTLRLDVSGDVLYGSDGSAPGVLTRYIDFFGNNNAKTSGNIRGVVSNFTGTSSGSQRRWFFYKCKVRSHTKDGFVLSGNSSFPSHIVNCIAEDCDDNPIEVRGGFDIINCVVKNGDTVDATQANRVEKCIFDGCGVEVSRGTALDSNVIYGASGSGVIFIGTSDGSTIINNSVSGCGGYGYEFASGLPLPAIFAHNHSHGNTSGHTNTGEDFESLGEGSNVTGDPLFVGAANGDFTPQDGSPLLDNGLAAGGESGDIGALKGASAAGGSGAPRIGSSLIHFGSVS